MSHSTTTTTPDVATLAATVASLQKGQDAILQYLADMAAGKGTTTQDATTTTTTTQDATTTTTQDATKAAITTQGDGKTRCSAWKTERKGKNAGMQRPCHCKTWKNDKTGDPNGPLVNGRCGYHADPLGHRWDSNKPMVPGCVAPGIAGTTTTTTTTTQDATVKRTCGAATKTPGKACGRTMLGADGRCKDHHGMPAMVATTTHEPVTVTPGTPPATIDAAAIADAVTRAIVAALTGK